MPEMPVPNVALPPGGSDARVVLRHSLILPSGSAAVMVVVGPGALNARFPARFPNDLRQPLPGLQRERPAGTIVARRADVQESGKQK